MTGAWLRLIPPVEAALPVVGFYSDVASGVAAVSAAIVCGTTPSAVEFVDGEAAALLLPSYPFDPPGPDVGFVVVAEADGTAEEARSGQAALAEALRDDSIALHQPDSRQEIDALWHWREGLGYAVESALGGKVSEDIVVPVDRLGEAVTETAELGRRHGLRACSWGHAGDGNLHSTFLLSPRDRDALARARGAADDLFALAGRLGGVISGEHGLGLVKSRRLQHQWPEATRRLHTEVKHVFDPKNLLNPGKKLA